MGLLCNGKGIGLQVLFFSSATISCSIASFKCYDLIAWEKDLGSYVEKMENKNALSTYEKLEL